MIRAARPGTAMTKALTEVGLTNKRPRRDFSITGIYHKGQRDCTIVVLYSRHAQAIVLENADKIERRCAELGWSVRVTTSTVTYSSKIFSQDVITSHVWVGN